MIDSQIFRNKRGAYKMHPNVLKLWKLIILDIGNCQICNIEADLDSPHHSHFGNMGASKDDRYLICICRSCHHDIHHGNGFKNLLQTREETESIGKENWYQGKEILEYQIGQELEGYCYGG